MLKSCIIQTPAGSMFAVGDEEGIHLLEFVEGKRSKRFAAEAGSTRALRYLQQELKAYFAKELTHFSTPLHCMGTPFQKRVWDELSQIPHGEVRSYAFIACAIGAPKAYRAVARANAKNSVVIIIPCHRVINADGKIGGYGGGVKQKQWLLHHESLFR